MSDEALLGFLVLGVLCLAAYFIPSIVAFSRGHVYRWIIFFLNVFAGWTGVLWVVAIVWAIWPQEKSLADPVLGNVSGTGKRNVGDTLGAVNYGRERGYQEEKPKPPRSKKTPPPIT
jgi:hypothetical protein